MEQFKNITQNGKLLVHNDLQMSDLKWADEKMYQHCYGFFRELLLVFEHVKNFSFPFKGENVVSKMYSMEYWNLEVASLTPTDVEEWMHERLWKHENMETMEWTESVNAQRLSEHPRTSTFMFDEIHSPKNNFIEFVFIGQEKETSLSNRDNLRRSLYDDSLEQYLKKLFDTFGKAYSCMQHYFSEDYKREVISLVSDDSDSDSKSNDAIRRIQIRVQFCKKSLLRWYEHRLQMRLIDAKKAAKIMFLNKKALEMRNIFQILEDVRLRRIGASEEAHVQVNIRAMEQVHRLSRLSENQWNLRERIDYLSGFGWRSANFIKFMQVQDEVDQTRADVFILLTKLIAELWSDTIFQMLTTAERLCGMPLNVSCVQYDAMAMNGMTTTPLSFKDLVEQTESKHDVTRTYFRNDFQDPDFYKNKAQEIAESMAETDNIEVI